MAKNPPVDPLVVVIGATGTGKSKLAVELATKFNGEIINGDAMQMYKGLPIITNKMPENERNGIPHHLLDFIGLDENPWTVTKFVKESSRVIDEIRSRGKLPIVVGGTHYYTHALLFKEAILGDDDGGSGSDNDEAADDIKWPILAKTTEEIYAKLQEVDPEMAMRWHPRDRRKIQTSLRIWLKTGRKASDVYAEQKTQKELLASGHGDSDANNAREGNLRRPTLLLWLEAESSILKQRLDDRVLTMVESGLLDEVLDMTDFEAEQVRNGASMDKSKGIWCSIGYKELESWVALRQSEDAQSVQLNRAREEGIASVQAATRRYAKRQNRYIRIRLANALEEEGAFSQLFLLDCSDLQAWESSVTEPAESLARAFLLGGELPEPKTLSEAASAMLATMQGSTKTSTRSAQTCQLCNKTLMTDREWQLHLKSRGHKLTVAAQRKRDKQSIAT